MLRTSGRRLFLVPLLTCACHTARIVSLASGATSPLPDRSCVVRLGGERVPLDRGRVTRDSITGTLRDGQRLAAPRDSVAFVEERHLSAGRTAGLAGGLLLGAIWMAALGAAAAMTSGWP
jgi:hypothetical protein